MATIATPNQTTNSPTTPVGPAGALAVTPSDANIFAVPVSIYVGTGGNVVVSPANGNADVTVVVPSGGMIPFTVLAVKATGTTATGIIAVY